MKKNFSVRLASILLFGAILVSACTQSYSQSPLATPTLIPTGLFVSPFPAGQDPLQIVADLGTQTAVAKTAEASSGTPGTPITAAVGTVITSTGPSLTPTLGTPVTVVVTTPAAVTVIPGGSTVTPQVTIVVPTGRPATYTLQAGEWPFCIARRFNVDPSELLALNGLVDSEIVDPGLVLRIPQSGSPFPGTRAWHTHPDTFTVDSSDTTIYGVACYYGDVFPEAIAKANNLPLSAVLSFGQRLAIP